jgi:hypothetical protein
MALNPRRFIQVLIAKTELELINYAHTDAEYKMEIDFPKVDDVKFAPTLHHLVVILGVVQEVSPKYNPIKVSSTRGLSWRNKDSLDTTGELLVLGFYR